MHSNAQHLGVLLLERNYRISVAESLTCGHLQSLIGSAGGASSYFVGGITAYNIDQKVALLGVERAHAAAVNCVSGEVAMQMVQGVCRLFGTDVGLATTGYADGVVTPFSYVGVKVREQMFNLRVEGSGRSRVSMQRHVAAQAVNALVRALEEDCFQVNRSTE